MITLREKQGRNYCYIAILINLKNKFLQDNSASSILHIILTRILKLKSKKKSSYAGKPK